MESDGGLVSSLRSYFANPHGETNFSERIWVGAADFSELSWSRFKKRNDQNSSYKIEPIFIDNKIFSKYYNGFSNATIWPLFHYFPSFAEFDESAFACYDEVNRLFRDKLMAIVQPGDTIWIHDYHLMLLPDLIRHQIHGVSIGFFLHIPFPSYEVFRLMHTSWKKKIVLGLLGSDLIGFHTSEYLQHFLKTMRMVSGFDHKYREIYHEGLLTKAEVFPLGIDFEAFNKNVGTTNIEAQVKAISDRFSNSKIIFSVDRLDYTKGVTHRLAGFEKFLELFPEWRGKVVFIMVVVPSRQIVSKYSERRKLIEEQVGRINGTYSTLEWQPIIYRYNNLGFDELCALYQRSDVALITPLRDGMNLVAKEYVASRINQDGVLILGELAGAASELGEAMMVNPTDKFEVANAIYNALQKPVAEQREEMSAMQRRIEKNNVTLWVREFLSTLNQTWQRQQKNRVRVLTDNICRELVSQFNRSKKRLLFLDYDGTLARIESHPGFAHPGQELLDLLINLSSIDNTEIVIISGRNHQVMQDWLGYLPIHLVAEHGASFKLKDDRWKHFTDIDSSWKDVIRATLDSFVDRTPGSFVEEKKYTMAWHYRATNEKIGFARSRELLDNLYNLSRNTHLNVLDGKKVIEVRAAGIDKGIVAREIMEIFPSDFVFAMGDDKTDEDIFNVLAGSAVTVKVGDEITSAKYRILNQHDAFEFLNHFAETKSVHH